MRDHFEASIGELKERHKLELEEGNNWHCNPLGASRYDVRIGVGEGDHGKAEKRRLRKLYTTNPIQMCTKGEGVKQWRTSYLETP